MINPEIAVGQKQAHRDGMNYLNQKAMFQTVLGRDPATWRLEKTLQNPPISKERSIINLVFPLNNIGLAHGDLCQYSGTDSHPGGRKHKD